MFKRSQRTATKVGEDLLTSSALPTIRDFIALLNSRGVERVQRESTSTYCSKILSSSGSQFTIYTDDGIRETGKPVGVLKRAKFQLARGNKTPSVSARRQISSLQKELLVLTNPRLRAHPNIVQLLLYDFIEEGDDVAIPVIIMERAQHGSLGDFLQKEPSLTGEERLEFCADMTAGLIALHSAEVLHGDMKPDNVLIFNSKRPDRRYQAKLSDFGSIISLKPSPASAIGRYYGTTLYNAPEVGDAQSQSQFDVEAMLRCDVYSLGLSMYQTINGELEDELSRKDANVLPFALQKIQVSCLEEHIVTASSEVLQLLLQFNPQKRCINLVRIMNLLNPLRESGITNSGDVFLTGQNAIGRMDEDVASNIESIFGSTKYLEYGWSDEKWLPESSQENIMAELQQQIKSSLPYTSGRAHFELALAHAIGLGTPVSIKKAMNAMTTSAKKGYQPAWANFAAWHRAKDHSADLCEETRLDWLYEATVLGSFFAASALQKVQTEEYSFARAEFHAAGGYNQYFYGKEPPEYINSQQFRDSLTSGQHLKSLEVLGWSAAIYGDVELLMMLIRHGLDPNITNNVGESLLVAACKAGHLTLVEALVGAGASAVMTEVEGKHIRESCLYWLIAFDSCDVEKAASLLFKAGAGSTGVEYVTWNHPSLDFPGLFPQAAALHCAVWFNHCEAIEQLCKHWPSHVNATAPHSELGSPLQYALDLWRLEPARTLIKHGALTDLEANRICLFDLGSLLNHESWLAHGLYDLMAGPLPISCIDLVNENAPSLLDARDDLGFTPLMQAAQSHSADIVKHLLRLGCSATSETPFENDGRTALNLLTENKLKYDPDDIIEMLLAAGADINHKTSKGGKNLLHFAARDNIVWIADRALSLGVDIESTTTYGETPLHCAAYYGGFDVGRLLLSKNANTEAVHGYATVNHRNWKGLTPLAWAAVKFRRVFVEMLLESGASVMARPRTRSTILHLAIGETDTRLLEMLLDMKAFQGAHVLNAKDSTHDATALHYCVGNIGKEAHAQLLIEAGADVNAVTSEGFSVLDLACETRGWFHDNLGEYITSVDPEAYYTDESFVGGRPAEGRTTFEGGQEIEEAVDEDSDSKLDGHAEEEARQKFHELAEFNHVIDCGKAYRTTKDNILLLESYGARRNQPGVKMPEGLMALD